MGVAEPICRNCTHWGIDARGNKSNALLRRSADEPLIKVCLPAGKGTTTGAKYVRENFTCDLFKGKS